MTAGIVVNVSSEDRRRLEAVIADRGAPQKHEIIRAQSVAAGAGQELGHVSQDRVP